MTTAATSHSGVMKSRRRRRHRNPEARRYQTTRAGRRGERDLGTPELQARRKRATGHTSLPCDPLAVLFGRELLSQLQYQAGRDLASLLETVRGITGSVEGPWLQILAGGLVSGGNSSDIAPAIERAWRSLARLRAAVADRLGVELAFRVAEGEWRPLGADFIAKLVCSEPWTGQDQRFHAALVAALERIAATWTGTRAV